MERVCGRGERNVGGKGGCCDRGGWRDVWKKRPVVRCVWWMALDGRAHACMYVRCACVCCQCGSRGSAEMKDDSSTPGGVVRFSVR